jgi:hypothetical protein
MKDRSSPDLITAAVGVNLTSRKPIRLKGLQYWSSGYAKWLSKSGPVTNLEVDSLDQSAIVAVGHDGSSYPVPLFREPSKRMLGSFLNHARVLALQHQPQLRPQYVNRRDIRNIAYPVE